MHILYQCSAETGGIAEYAVRHVDALADAGASVTLLCRPSLATGRVRNAIVRAVLPSRPERASGLVRRVGRQIMDCRAIARVVEAEVCSGQYDSLLIASYSEFFSPFWAGFYLRIAQHLPIGTIAHDPVRDHVVGPHWWHRWSVRRAYSFVTHVFVHDETPVDFGGPCPARVTTHVIPHGPYPMNPGRVGRQAVRQRYRFAEGDLVFISFGQIRDGKNLDRFLRVMPRLPDNVKLLVAGASGGSSLRQPEDYQELAGKLGVAGRCVWDIRYIPDDEVCSLFAAADLVLMTYSAKFRSASGVLNTAVSCRKLILASSGEGPIRSVMAEYNLGVIIPPDDDASILNGARQLITTPPVPDWERYERENSWEENAKRVIAAFRK
jgi:glycosyltransferase involved in cell wall biosynthesis